MKKLVVILLALGVGFAMAGAAAAEDFGLGSPAGQASFETSGAYEGPFYVKRIAAGPETWKAVFRNGWEINSNRQGSNACMILSIAQALQAPVYVQRNSYGYIEAVSMGDAP